MKLYAVVQESDYGCIKILALCSDRTRAEMIANVYRYNDNKVSVDEFEDGEYNKGRPVWWRYYSSDEGCYMIKFDASNRQAIEERKCLDESFYYQVYVSANSQIEAIEKARTILKENGLL